MATYQGHGACCHPIPQLSVKFGQVLKIYQNLSESVSHTVFGRSGPKLNMPGPGQPPWHHSTYGRCSTYTAHTYHLKRHIHFSIHPSQAIRYSLFVSSLNSDATARQRARPATSQRASQQPRFLLLPSILCSLSCFSLPSFHFGNSLALSFPLPTLAIIFLQRRKARPAHRPSPLLTYSHVIPYILPYSHPPSVLSPIPFPLSKNFLDRPTRPSHAILS